MKQQLIIPLDELLQSSWKEIKHYHLTSQQFDVLLSHPKLDWEECHFPAGEKYREIRNEKDELALVISGSIVHEIEGRAYEQRRGEIIIIPSNIVHSAEIGRREDCIAYAYYKNKTAIGF